MNYIKMDGSILAQESFFIAKSIRLKLHGLNKYVFPVVFQESDESKLNY